MDIPLKLHRTRLTAPLLASALLLYTAASGCVNKDSNLVWKETIPSPDGRYIATAETIQNGGFGSAYVGTVVELQQTHIPETKTIVISFDCEGPVPRPYTLDNVANKGGTINLSLKWTSPTVLLVTYSDNPTIDFQAVIYQVITIKLEKLNTSKDENIQTKQPDISKPIR